MWVSDVGVWVYVYVCEKGRTKEGPGEVLRVLLWSLSPHLDLPSSLEHDSRLRSVILFGRSLIFPKSNE